MPTLQVINQLTGLGFPEALRWRAGQLWFSDMFRGEVICWQPGAPSKVVLSADKGGPKMPGGLGWTPLGELLVVDCLERRVLKLDSEGTIRTYADLTERSSYPLNDMHVDEDGTAWIGGYGFDPEVEKPKKSPIYRVSSEGVLTNSEPKFTFPNGFDRRHSELVVAETFSDRVTFFDDQFQTRKTFACHSGAGPDGLAFDGDGNLFVAMAFRSTIEKLDSHGIFQVIHQIQTPAGSLGGEIGVFDCAIRLEDGILAYSSACLDEAYSKSNNTGSITLVQL